MLDKAIASGRERRKPYRDSRRFDYSCRHQGGCPHCERSRLINHIRTEVRAREALNEADRAATPER